MKVIYVDDFWMNSDELGDSVILSWMNKNQFIQLDCKNWFSKAKLPPA